MTANVGEYGLALNVNANYNLTGATSLTLDITRPDGTTFSRTGASVTAPNANYTVPDASGNPTAEVYAAGKYGRYIVAQGDLTVPGTYIARLSYTDASPKHLISDPVSFTVNP